MTARANTKNLLEQWESGTWATPLNALFRRQLTFPFLLLNQPIKVQTHGWRHGKLLFFGLSNNGWAMARSFENFARLYRIKQVKAVHMMLLPSQKPSSSYSLLKFVYVSSQLYHSFVVHPLLRKILDPPCRFNANLSCLFVECDGSGICEWQAREIWWWYTLHEVVESIDDLST